MKKFNGIVSLVLVLAIFAGSIMIINGLHNRIDELENTKTTGNLTVNDLLDAIMEVESGGDANAVGDWVTHTYNNCGIESPCLIDFRKDKVFRKNNILYCKHAQAIGAYQIHKIYVRDVNRIYRKIAKDCKSEVYPIYTYKDRWNKAHSRMMAKTYILYYGMDKGIEAMARIHNSGPDGWRNDPQWFVRNRGYTLEQAKKKIRNAKTYWLKVEKCLKNN